MMKKTILKGCLLAAFLCSYFFIPSVQTVLNQKINTVTVTNFLAKNLYKNEKTVSSIPLVVKDYILQDNRLYIFPLDEVVSLPIDVMIVEVEDTYIEVVNLDARYRISNIYKRAGNLYQYVNGLNELAYTKDFFVVEGDNLEVISERLTIYYEKV